MGQRMTQEVGDNTPGEGEEVHGRIDQQLGGGNGEVSQLAK